MLRFFSLVFSAVLFLSSCGGGKGGFSDGTPLNEDQRRDLVQLLNSSGELVDGVKRAAQHRNGNESGPEIAKKLIEAKCVGSFSEPKESEKTEFHWLTQIGGNSCPIEVKSTNDFYITDKTTWRALTNIGYQLKDKAFTQWTDIMALRFQGSVESSLNGGQIEVRGSHSGSISSLRYGTISLGTFIDFTLSSSSVSGQAAIQIETPKYRVVFREVLSGSPQNPKIEYLLNGEPLSKQEFRGLLEKSRFLRDMAPEK